MKVSSVPETTPGIDSGKVTLRKVVHGLAYRSPAASCSRPSIRSSDVYSGRIMNGRKLYVRPHTTAIGVASTRSPAVQPSQLVTSRTCSVLSAPTTGPPSARIVFQARVRIRKLVKNGATTRIMTRFFQRPARKAIRYASG
jgi:hypothetical protein